MLIQIVTMLATESGTSRWMSVAHGFRRHFESQGRMLSVLLLGALVIGLIWLDVFVAMKLAKRKKLKPQRR